VNALPAIWISDGPKPPNSCLLLKRGLRSLWCNLGGLVFLFPHCPSGCISGLSIHIPRGPWEAPFLQLLLGQPPAKHKAELACYWDSVLGVSVFPFPNMQVPPMRHFSRHTTEAKLAGQLFCNGRPRFLSFIYCRNRTYKILLLDSATPATPLRP
jgi:hypothetical protein